MVSDPNSTGVIHAIARPVVNAQFPHAFGNRFAVPEISGSHTLYPHWNTGAGLTVWQIFKPFRERIMAIVGQVIFNRIHAVDYTLQIGKFKGSPLVKRAPGPPVQAYNSIFLPSYALATHTAIHMK